MSNPTPVVKVTTSDPSVVQFTDAQRDRFLAAVSWAFARQASEVLAPSGTEVFMHAPNFQLTADGETVEGWFIQFDGVDSFGLNTKVGYTLANSKLTETEYEVSVTLEFVLKTEEG